MQSNSSIGSRVLLFLGGVLAAGIGAALLFAPASFHGANGIELGSDVNLLSEVRAPGGVLLLTGIAMLAGAFVRSLAGSATAIGAAVFLAYGLSRLIAMVLDGVPGTGLVAATAIELALGALLARSLRSAAGCNSPASSRPRRCGARRAGAEGATG